VGTFDNVKSASRGAGGYYQAKSSTYMVVNEAEIEMNPYLTTKPFALTRASLKKFAAEVSRRFSLNFEVQAGSLRGTGSSSTPVYVSCSLQTRRSGDLNS